MAHSAINTIMEIIRRRIYCRSTVVSPEVQSHPHKPPLEPQPPRPASDLPRTSRVNRGRRRRHGGVPRVLPRRPPRPQGPKGRPPVRRPHPDQPPEVGHGQIDAGLPLPVRPPRARAGALLAPLRIILPWPRTALLGPASDIYPIHPAPAATTRGTTGRPSAPSWPTSSPTQPCCLPLKSSPREGSGPLSGGPRSREGWRGRWSRRPGPPSSSSTGCTRATRWCVGVGVGRVGGRSH